MKCNNRISSTLLNMESTFCLKKPEDCNSSSCGTRKSLKHVGLIRMYNYVESGILWKRSFLYEIFALIFTLQNVIITYYKRGRSSKRVAVNSCKHIYVYRLYKSNLSLRLVAVGPVAFQEVSERLDYNQHMYKTELSV
jgi:hypothetical protein